jgi:hypothetical protein
MDDEQLSDFILAGGTNLALQIGHRKSIDLDLFTYKQFETAKLTDYLCEQYNMKIKSHSERSTIIGFINDIKIDMIAHIYPLLKEPVIENGIRMYALPDIVAMKLVAISDNGTRLKDFVDVAYMSTLMSLSEMITYYTTKFPNTVPLRALKGLSYHDEIDFDASIELCNGKQFQWKKIEQRIRDMIKFENKIFDDYPI